MIYTNITIPTAVEILAAPTIPDITAEIIEKIPNVKIYSLFFNVSRSGITNRAFAVPCPKEGAKIFKIPSKNNIFPNSFSPTRLLITGYTINCNTAFIIPTAPTQYRKSAAIFFFFMFISYFRLSFEYLLPSVPGSINPHTFSSAMCHFQMPLQIFQ